ncbi:hypothetical protein C8F04DRAFT_1404858 [Mycena alexandri]|uniref:Uncharacterized protein n=1 Tax=Mycena alexandri TaxID=1745969 RepID=A0AAD6WRT0_9AGAR|nr:hypothetical protein C8F04DRAFT_1404858 [Mycena alexandri]
MGDLAALRDELAQNTHFLANANIPSTLTWKKIGSDNVLVSTEAAAKYDNAVQPTTDNEETPTEVPELDPALLSMVAKVATSDFWLTPCGHWKGPTSFTPTFADLKLNCRLVAHEDSVFKGDFKKVLDNVSALMAKAATSGHSRQGIFDPKEQPKTSLKVRHVVFAEKAPGDDDGGYDLRDWPVKSPAAREALVAMEDTHRVYALPAYDINGNLIPPSQYGTLMGAVVRATISLSHWNIAREARDSYVADIVSLRVLVPAAPIASTSSPRKRKAVETTDPGASPMKKARN